MPECGSCGQDNPEDARFCLACGARLAVAAVERRRTATLLFCDMSGSTAMGERVDAESVRDLMFRYFHEMRGAIEGHGGTVEKFVGDAVMAVFGVPVAREDDALRAVRAAWEMQGRLRELNVELARKFGTTVALRIGVNTGEVVAGDASLRQMIVTGDAVNVAARLEQSAKPGEILLGSVTNRLVRDAATTEPIEPLTVKGKTTPLDAFRVIDVSEGTAAPLRGRTSSFEGRSEELKKLTAAFDETIANHRCLRVTVVGEPGVGKSRLVAEFLSSLEQPALILRGRCLPYGEGITFWPIVEMVRQAAQIRDEHSAEDARARIRSAIQDEAEGSFIGVRVAQAVGLGQGNAPANEITWALRRFFESIADRQPLVLVIDDLQWGEDALVEVFARMPELASGPILIVCLARPELADTRQDLDGTIRLDPLGGAETERLIERLIGDAAGAKQRSRIATAAAGNPLFAEELVAMMLEGSESVRDHEEEGIAIPATLSSLLEARLDQISESERATLERCSIEGEVFHRGGVVELSEQDVIASVQNNLESLSERGFIRPTQATFVDEAAFQFRHLLVREAAYRGIPKKWRAQMHERFGAWLESKAGDRLSEYEEIVGYHFEQAYRNALALGPPGEHERAVGMHASSLLRSSGHRGFDRGDAAAAVRLLGRAVSLLPDDDPTRIETQLVLAEALEGVGDSARAVVVVDEAGEAAVTLGDPRLIARTEVLAALLRMRTDPDSALAVARETATRAIAVFEQSDDAAGLAKSWRLLGWPLFLAARATETEQALRRAIEYGRRAGDRWDESENLTYLAEHGWRGPLSMDAALVRCDEIVAQGNGDRRLEALVALNRGILEALRGRFSEARDLVRRARPPMEEFGLLGDVALSVYVAGYVELLADDLPKSETLLRTALEGEEMDLDAQVVLALGEVLYRQARYEEALTLVEKYRGSFSHLSDEVGLASLKARLLAQSGRLDEAEAIARDAVARGSESDYLLMRGNSFLALGEVLALVGRREEGAEAAREALQLFDRKGSTVFRARALSLLSAMG